MLNQHNRRLTFESLEHRRMLAFAAEGGLVGIKGTNGDDTIRVFGDAGGVNVKGLIPVVGILHPEGANDRLDINTLAGNDTVVANGLAPGVIQLFEDGIPVP